MLLESNHQKAEKQQLYIAVLFYLYAFFAVYE